MAGVPVPFGKLGWVTIILGVLAAVTAKPHVNWQPYDPKAPDPPFKIKLELFTGKDVTADVYCSIEIPNVLWVDNEWEEAPGHEVVKDGNLPPDGTQVCLLKHKKFNAKSWSDRTCLEIQIYLSKDDKKTVKARYSLPYG